MCPEHLFFNFSMIYCITFAWFRTFYLYNSPKKFWENFKRKIHAKIVLFWLLCHEDNLNGCRTLLKPRFHHSVQGWWATMNGLVYYQLWIVFVWPPLCLARISSARFGGIRIWVGGIQHNTEPVLHFGTWPCPLQSCISLPKLTGRGGWDGYSGQLPWY